MNQQHQAIHPLRRGADLFKKDFQIRQPTVQTVVDDTPPQMEFLERSDTREFLNSRSINSVPITKEIIRMVSTMFIYFYVPFSKLSFAIGTTSTLPLFLTNLETEQIQPRGKYVTRSSMFFEYTKVLSGAENIGGITACMRYTLNSNRYETTTYLNRARQPCILLTTHPSELHPILKNYIETNVQSYVYVTDFTSYSVDNAIFDTNKNELVWFNGRSIDVFQNMFFTTMMFDTLPGAQYKCVMPVELYVKFNMIVRTLLGSTSNGLMFERFQITKGYTTERGSLDVMRSLPVDVDRDSETYEVLLSNAQTGLNSTLLSLLELDVGQDILNILSASSVSARFDAVAEISLTVHNSNTNKTNSFVLNSTSGYCGNTFVFPSIDSQPCPNICNAFTKMYNDANIFVTTYKLDN